MHYFLADLGFQRLLKCMKNMQEEARTKKVDSNYSYSKVERIVLQAKIMAE